MPDLQDAEGLRREAPPTTDQTHGPKWSRFWLEPTRGNLLRGIEAIFEFQPPSGDTGALNQIKLLS